MILARKTKISKWNRAKNECIESNESGAVSIEILNVDTLNADVITSELRTSSNNLSTWIVDESLDNDDGISDVVIALTTGTNIAHIETIDLLFIDTNDVNIFKFDNTEEGDTSVEKLKDKHYNICNINYKQLGEISKYFMQQVMKKKFIKLSKGEVKNIIKNALENNIVTIENFAPSIHDEIIKIQNS